jgi:hypothetical protein
MESVLGHSPNNVTHAEVVGELVAELQRVEGRRLKLEGPNAKICDLLLQPTPGRAWLGDCLEESIRCCRVEVDARREVEANLEALQSSMTRVRGLVLGDTNGSSTQATSMFTVVELLEGRIDTVAANGVHWESCSTLVAAVSHFPKLDVNLEVLKYGHSVGLTEDDVDALWSQVRTAVNPLASHVPSSVAHNPPDGASE